MELAMSKSPFKDAVRIHCPCADSPADAQPVDENAGATDGDDAEETRIFDPTQPRAKYSLHTLGYLYFCQECQSIRCPRCVQEEIVSAFCPMCLFEVPLTSIKADGNRCVRNCFQCPICFAGLSVFPNEETQAAPYTLNCMYCQWSTSEIGIEFEKPTGIAGQLSKMALPHAETQSDFEAIRDHYADLFDTGRPSDDAMASFTSRYSALLSGKGSFKARQSARQSTRSLYSRIRPPSRDTDEKPLEYANAKTLEDDNELVARLQSMKSLDETTDIYQRAKQLNRARWEETLWPVSMQLRAKRSKRCRACRHILVKPENKPTSTRFRIKMLALNYIPTINIRPNLDAGTPVSPSSDSPLQPGVAKTFILTITNPLYDPVRLTLSTPAMAPGPCPHSTTILRPEFTVGANADIWNDDDEILPSSERENRRSRFGIYEAKRNMVSIFMEVIPASPRTKGEGAPKGEIPVEIPIFVKMIYKVEDVEKDDTLTLMHQVMEEKGKGKVEKEIGYWVVIQVGSMALA